jgi:hypothetical protein
VEQRSKQRWRAVTDRIDLLIAVGILALLVGIVIFVLGSTLPTWRATPLSQLLGGALIGAGLSALIGAAAGRQAIRQQSAKDANLARKRETYGPLYAELKALRTAFSDAQAGTAPLPLWIDDGVGMKGPGVPLFTSPPVTLKLWSGFRRNYQDTDFKATTQTLLDDVQRLAAAYNTAAQAARDPAVRLLAQYIDAAISELRQREYYKQWQEQDAKRKANQVPLGHAPKTEHDWYGYIEDVVPLSATPLGRTPGEQLAALWITSWPATYQSYALGWLLAGHPDKAADYVRRNYPADTMDRPPPPLDWIQGIFREAWPEMQQAASYREAVEAGETLFERVQSAENTLADGLRRIQERYEGGEPLV